MPEILHCYYCALVVVSPWYFHLQSAWTPRPSVRGFLRTPWAHNWEGNCGGAVDQSTAPQYYVLLSRSKEDTMSVLRYWHSGLATSWHQGIVTVSPITPWACTPWHKDLNSYHLSSEIAPHPVSTVSYLYPKFYLLNCNDYFYVDLLLLCTLLWIIFLVSNPYHCHWYI